MTKQIRELMRNRTFLIVALAVLIRLVLMPLFLHDDLAAEYWRAYQVLSGASSDSLSLLRIVGQIFHVGALALLIAFIPNIGNLMNPRGVSVVYYYPDNAAFQNAWQQFISQGNILWVVFLFKLPYLLVDLACAYIVTKFSDDPKTKQRLLTIWLFNPVNLFATYMWGRFDILLVMFTLLCLYFLIKKQYLWSVVALAAASLVKIAAMMPAPFVLMYIARARGVTQKQLAAIIAALVGSFVVLENVLKTGILNKIDSNHFRYLFELHYSVQHYLFASDTRTVYIFPLFFTLLLISFFLISKPTIKHTVAYSMIGMLSYFVLGYFHEHYFIWVLPFIMLAWGYVKDMDYLFWGQMIAYSIVFILPFIITFWLPGMRGSLALPQFAQNFVSSDLYLAIKNAAYIYLTATNVFIAYRLWQSVNQSTND